VVRGGPAEASPPDRYLINEYEVHDARNSFQGGAMTDQPGPPQGSGPPPGGGRHAAKPKKRNFFLRHKILSAVLVLLLLFIVIGISNGGSKSATTTTAATPPTSTQAQAPAATTSQTAPPPTTTAAAPPTTTQAPAPTTGVAPVQLLCSDVGGVFVPHGMDGRGDCEPADPRPRCHVPPAAQEPNYLANLTMTPPFPSGTVDYPVLIGMASNKDCWKQPAGQ